MKLWSIFKTDYLILLNIYKNMSERERVKDLLLHTCRLGAAAHLYSLPDANKIAARVHVMLAIDAMRYSIPREWNDWGDRKFKSFIIECLRNSPLSHEEIEELLDKMPGTL